MLISIDICCDMVYIVEGNTSGGYVEVNKCDEADLPLGTIDNGEIKNHSALVMTISKLLNARNYKSNNAVLTFTSNSVLSRRLELPPAKPREISSMVHNQMVQSVNDPKDYVFEYSYAQISQAKDKPIGVWAYALEKEFVEKYFSIFKGLKCRFAALDIHCNCVEKLMLSSVVNGSPLAHNSVLLVDIEREFIEIHLLSGGERAFSRISPVSISEFLMIADNLGYSRHAGGKNPSADFDVTQPDGQKKKKPDIISYDTLDISAEALQKDSILAEAARQYTGNLADELLKMVQFQLRRNSSVPVSSVYIYGRFSNINGLGANLSSALSCPVETITNVSNVKVGADISLSKYINAIGALIRL